MPDQLEYTRSHEWIRQEDNIATIGITDYAQYMLGEIVSVDLPDNGDTLYAGGSFGAVKSVEFVSVLCTPVGGEVVAINDALFDAPWLINGDPYAEGWAIRVLVTQEATFSPPTSTCACTVMPENKFGKQQIGGWREQRTSRHLSQPKQGTTFQLSIENATPIIEPVVFKHFCE